jgi:hypothetical protein
MSDDNSTRDSGMDQITKAVNEWARSRRSFMGDAAKLGGGTLALSAGIGTAAADDGSGDVESQDTGGFEGLSDLQILKFALLLERLEATFYTEAVGTAPVGENSDDGRLSEFELELSRPALQFVSEQEFTFSTYEYFQRIRDHEQAHVDALAGVIENITGEPVSEGPEFAFPYDSAEDFVALAQVFEDTGAAAYTSAAPFLASAYVAPAAKILAVEARHASYLRVLTTEEQVPFPRAFQKTLSVNQIQNRIAPFIVDG